MITTKSIYQSSVRQINHWLVAARRLSMTDNLASANAWQGIDHGMAVTLRESFKRSIDDVIALAQGLAWELDQARDIDDRNRMIKSVLQLRNRYLRAEETIHFYSVAINSRTTPGLSALLRACDVLCVRSMRDILKPLGKETPGVLTYVDKGVGASILKAGLRLWDGNVSTIAAIKVTQHNLYRPTAIIHETGHQVAHVLNWNDEIASAIQTSLTQHHASVRAAFAGWSSEMTADAFAFVHTGFAAVAALHDVVSGDQRAVFAYHEHDPHPISYIRVLLNIEMCRQCHGSGPWDDLSEAFTHAYQIDAVRYPSVPLIRMCVRAIPDVARLLLHHPSRAFRGRSLAQMIPPERVSPEALARLEYLAGPALLTSHAWVSNECLRLLALIGYKIGTGTGDLPALYRQQEEWMTRLGYAIELN